MKKPLASSITPNYDHAHYVGDAIISIRAQAYPHFEIIVVDDGSTDSSSEVIGGVGDRARDISIENQVLPAVRT